MLISHTSLQCHLLFDCNITNMKNNQTFGSQLVFILIVHYKEHVIQFVML